MAVVALGGYARRELCPASDIDLLLLHDGWGRTDLEGLVEALCYPLWDARLSVGHAVRTPAEAVSDTAGEIDTATALLDRRLVAGDRGLYDALASKVGRWVRRHQRSVLVRLGAADEARHRTSGSHPGMLEPDLKNGAGGLRDIHSLRWAAALLLGEIGLDPLVAAGYLSPHDRRRLAEANAALLRVRCALHATGDRTGKGVDVLRLDRQDEVAATLASSGEASDADRLLLEVGLAMRVVAHLHDRTWDLLLADAERGRRRRRDQGRDLGGGLRLSGRLVHIDDVEQVRSDPALGLRAVAVAAANGARLSRHSAAGVTRVLASGDPPAWTGETRKALLTLLHAGQGAGDGLAEADHLGMLGAFLPDWPRVRGRPQRNALHRYDLDTHGAEAVVALHALRHDESLDQVWRGLDDPDALVLATWLHDIGKAWPGDHATVGADVACDWLQMMGFDAATVERVSLLVRLHLLLPDVATRRDLDDPDEVAAVAKAVGDTDVLDSLYLLSLADGRATGPAAWSPWKDNLLATLRVRATAVLVGADGPPPADPLEQAGDLGAPARGLADLAAIAPARYLAAADAAQVAAHAVLLEHRNAAGAAVDLRPGPTPDTTVVSVVAADRDGLVADCAGVLTAAELQLVEARAVTGEGGIALDWFTVTGSVDTGWLIPMLLSAAEGAVDVEALLARPRWGRPAATGSRREPVVAVRSQRALELDAPDSPGLLYRVCSAIAGAGFALDAVRASTLGPSVFAVFEVRPARPSADIEPLANQVLSATTRPI